MTSDTHIESKSYEYYMELVRQCGTRLVDVPEKFITAELCSLAVEKNLSVNGYDQNANGYALKYVPKKFITPELCLSAVRQNGYLLKYVPEKLKTRELCEIAADCKKIADGVSSGIRFIPENILTEAMCLTAVKNRGKELFDIPEKMRTYKVCLAAVKHNVYWANIRDVPAEHRTKELCLEVMKRYVRIFKEKEELIPGEYWKDAEFCKNAVNANPCMLKFVPVKIKTFEMCLAAVKADGYALRFVPKKLRTLELCVEAVIQNQYDTRKFVPKEIIQTVYAKAGFGNFL